MRFLKILSISLGILSILFGACAFAEKLAPIVRQSVDKRQIYIGDRIRYTISLKLGKDTRVAFPKFPNEKIGEFEIKDSGAKTAKSIFGKSRNIRHWYELSIFASGKQAIPQVEIKYRDKDDVDWKMLKTDPIDITVRSVLAEERNANDIKDIKGPIHLFEMSWLFISMAVIAIIAAAIFMLYIYRRRRRPLPAKLPHETALEELEAIRALYARGGGLKEYYVGISDCVRRYIERAFSLRAPEMTTEEFLNSLRDSKVLSPNYNGELTEFLNACDLVKFAKYGPTRIEIGSVFDTAFKFVEETKGMFASIREPSI